MRGSCQPIGKQRRNLVRRIFDDPMSDVFQPMGLRLGPVATELVETSWREAPVLHPPDQLDGQVGQGWELRVDLLKRAPGGVAGGERDVFYKLVDRLPVLPVMVGGKIGLLDSRVEVRGSVNRHPQGGSGEGIGALQGKFSKKRPATDANSERDEPGRKSAGVEQGDSLKAIA